MKRLPDPQTHFNRFLALTTQQYERDTLHPYIVRFANWCDLQGHRCTRDDIREFIGILCNYLHLDTLEEGIRLEQEDQRAKQLSAIVSADRIHLQVQTKGESTSITDPGLLEEIQKVLKERFQREADLFPPTESRGRSPRKQLLKETRFFAIQLLRRIFGRETLKEKIEEFYEIIPNATLPSTDSQLNKLIKQAEYFHPETETEAENSMFHYDTLEEWKFYMENDPFTPDDLIRLDALNLPK